jgi:hypothetical protein
MQTCLEKKGIESRQNTLVRNDYNRTDVYSDRHEDALSTGDALGKGTGRGEHTHSIPDCTKPSAISYANFDTNGGGGLYDIEGRNGNGGRNFLKTISKYNSETPYGAHLIDTSANLADGQIII